MDLLKVLNGACPAAGGIAGSKAPQMLVEQRANRAHRIERGQRLLGNESDVLAEERLTPPRRQADQILALEVEGAVAHGKAMGQHAGDQPADHGFARARFADHPQQLAGLKVE